MDTVPHSDSLKEQLQNQMKTIRLFRSENMELAKENKKLKARLVWLDCLEAAGVDNWGGIDYAYELKRGGK